MRFTAAMGSSIGIANFESVNFFNNNKYLKMQGMDEVHPLISIRSFARIWGWNPSGWMILPITLINPFPR